jgi:predicted nucleotidyltransferase
MMNLTHFRISDRQLGQFCQNYHIRKLAFFGSVVRDDFKPSSDIDILVEFEPGFTPGFDFFLIEAELSRLLRHKVDLQTTNFLSPEIRQYAQTEAITAYEQA